ncbi:MAG: CotH kinase family protein [Flavobacteriales bacterium]|nr:CotH kinase family protein [Flavobacteriales bacterium]
MRSKVNIAFIYFLLVIGVSYAFMSPAVKWTELPNYAIDAKHEFSSDAETYYSTDGHHWVKDQSQLKFFLPKGIHRLSAVSTSIRWKAPVGNFPACDFYVSCQVDRKNKKRSALNYHFHSLSTSGIPQMALWINPDDFFSNESGIYVMGNTSYFSTNVPTGTPWWERPANYKLRGKKWARGVHVMMNDANGNLVFESDASARIHGNATRAYPQKSIRLSAKGKKKNTGFTGDVFSEGKAGKWKDLILRNGGNDWDRTMISDEFIHRHFSHWPELGVHLIAQRYVPVELFINGEYWGLHNLRERINEDYLSNRFSVSKKDVAIIEGTTLSHGNKRDVDDFNQLLDFCRTKDLSLEENYNYVKQRLNIPAFVAYLVTEIYVANTDWPANNVKCFRINDSKADSSMQKWNFVLWDMDYGMAYSGKDAFTTNMIQRIRNSKSPIGILFKSLDHSLEFKQMFGQTLNQDPKLNSETLISSFQQMSDRIEPVMPQQIRRWRRPLGMEEWKNFLQLQIEFLENRHQEIMKHYKNDVSEESIRAEKASK